MEVYVDHALQIQSRLNIISSLPWPATLMQSYAYCFCTTLLFLLLPGLDIYPGIKSFISLTKFLQMASSADTERTLLEALRYKHNQANMLTQQYRKSGIKNSIYMNVNNNKFTQLYTLTFHSSFFSFIRNNLLLAVTSNKLITQERNNSNHIKSLHFYQFRMQCS